MKKILYLALAAVLFVGCTKDIIDVNAHIHGTVVANGEPVNAAAILLTPGGGTKITGSDGMYDFTDLEQGKYELKVYKEGFQSFNKSIEVKAGKDEELAITLSASQGKLSLNKAYIDMGSNESNNVAGFSIVNSGNAELAWSVTNAAGWITDIDPKTGTVNAIGSTAVVFTIDRSKLNANTADNYATLIVRSTTAGDGSTAELLVTVFGTGDGTNTTISDKDYVIIGDLYVQTKDLGGRMDWTSANNAAENSTTGGFDDWRLPNTAELGMMYSKKEAIGNFVTDYNNTSLSVTKENTGYWTSDKYSSTSYYWMSFYDGSMDYDYQTGYNRRCRPVRKSSPLPVVATLAATNVTANAATLNGKIENKGEPAFTERGFVYSNTFQNPTVEDDESTTTKRVVSGTSVDFSANIANLTAEQTYYVRAYAVNNNGTVYGSSVSFKPTAVVDYVVLQSEGIMVQKNDISSGADWNTAKSLCENSTVGGKTGWRLPTIGELQALYSNRVIIGGFSTTTDSYYWSGTRTNGYSSYYKAINFNNGNMANYDVDSNSHGYYTSSNRVRAVRTLP
ncbi:MAG: DUF1566 domain-containing protein [Prevotellaceae bacterium]|jgi:hypothetical protein|nr:DUF1566 domain-containing protein [Prevotellaceae bacterium]